MAIEIGLQVQPQHASFDAMRDAFREADALGADAIYTWDHFFPLTGDPDGTHFEAMTTLAVLAEVTERARVGALVSCNSYRNPELLADMHRTIDHISGGRAILGVGAGWFERDYDEYGYEFGTAPDRVRALRDALPRIEARLAALNPGPVNGAIPLLIGGSGPKVTLRLVARHAQMWHGFGDADAYRAKSAILAEHCAAIGRDPAEITRCWGIHGDLFAHAEALVEAGVKQLVVDISGDGDSYDLSDLRRMLAWRDAHE